MVTQWPVDDMIHWYLEDGLSTTDIGNRTGSNSGSVSWVLRRAGVQMRSTGGPRRGPTNHFWKGGRKVEDGYVMLWMPDHPDADKHGYVREHRLVAAQKLGRPLRPEEVAHHLNGDKADNRPENIEVFASNAEHLRVTLKGRCPKWTEDGLCRIREAAVRKRGPRAKRFQLRGGDGRYSQTPAHSTAEPDTGSESLSQTALTLCQ